MNCSPVGHPGAGRDPGLQAPRVERGALGPGICRDDGVAAVALQFEALFVGQLLKAARAAALAETPLTGGGDFAGAIDAARAQALAAAAPLGVAKGLK